MDTANQIPVMLPPFEVTASRAPSPAGFGGGQGSGGFGDLLKSIVGNAASAATSIYVAKETAKANAAPSNGNPVSEAPATVLPLPGAGVQPMPMMSLPPWAPIAGVVVFVGLLLAIVLRRR